MPRSTSPLWFSSLIHPFFPCVRQSETIILQCLFSSRLFFVVKIVSSRVFALMPVHARHFYRFCQVIDTLSLISCCCFWWCSIWRLMLWVTFLSSLHSNRARLKRKHVMKVKKNKRKEIERKQNWKETGLKDQKSIKKWETLSYYIYFLFTF